MSTLSFEQILWVKLFDLLFFIFKNPGTFKRIKEELNNALFAKRKTRRSKKKKGAAPEKNKFFKLNPFLIVLFIILLMLGWVFFQGQSKTRNRVQYQQAILLLN